MALKKLLRTFPLWFPNGLVRCIVKDQGNRWWTYFAHQCMKTLIVLLTYLFNDNIIIRPIKPFKVPSIRTTHVKLIQPTQKIGICDCFGLIRVKHMLHNYEQCDTTCLLATSKTMSIYFMSKLLEAIQNSISFV